MARSEARIKTSIWHDPDFVALDPFAQWVYMLAVSQATVNFCGVTPYTPRKWSHLANGVTVTHIRKAVAILVAHDYVLVDEDTEELWIRTFVKHDGVLTKPNVTVAMSRDFAAIQSPLISERFLEGLGERFLEHLDQPLRERLAEPFLKRFRKRFPEPYRHGMANPSGNHSATVTGTVLAPAHAEPPPPPPASTSASPPAANGSATHAGHHPTPQAETETETTSTEPPGDPLVDHWLTDVLNLPPGKRRAKPLIEAHQVINHLRQHLDEGVIGERIAYLATIEDKPRSARYLLKCCTDWAAERDLPIPPMP